MINLSIMGFSFYELFFFFLIYSFLGWLLEVAYAFTNRGYFVNRGFLFGPFCPLYGTCGVLLIVFLNAYKNNFILLFILATIITSAIEYFTGYILETLFNSKWWDYTDDPFNLNGRICLHFSLAWGLASVLVLKIIHPIIAMLVFYIPHTIGNSLFHILALYFLCDILFTLMSLITFKNILTHLNDISSELKNKYNYIFSNTKEKANDIKSPIQDLIKNYNNWLSKLNINHKRLLKAFPTIKSTKFSNQLNDVKNKFFAFRGDKSKNLNDSVDDENKI